MQVFVDQLVYFYYFLSLVRSDQSTLGDCAVAERSRRLRRLAEHLIARRQSPRRSAGICPVLGQLERLGGPVSPSVVVRRLRRSSSVAARRATAPPDLSNRADTCRATLHVTRELCQLLTCMLKFYRRCSF